MRFIFILWQFINESFLVIVLIDLKYALDDDQIVLAAKCYAYPGSIQNLDLSQAHYKKQKLIKQTIENKKFMAHVFFMECSRHTEQSALDRMGSLLYGEVTRLSPWLIQITFH